MTNKVINSLTFIVLCYNHENFIIEHLESIKYLINEYGNDWENHIVISDDCSKDNTKKLIKDWIKENKNLFKSVNLVFNNNNLGTCQSVINSLSKVETNFIKITAGDDVYSFENIYDLTSIVCSDFPIVSGIPLELLGSEIKINRNSLFEILATQSIFSDLPLISRFKFATNNNAPNMMYIKEALTNEYLIKNLKEYDVVEDWPICISIADLYPYGKFKLIDKVFVYYRRTINSTHLIANKRFKNDQLKVFDYLIRREINLIIKLMLLNRKLLFIVNKSFFKKFINISNLYFLINSIINSNEILPQFIKIDLKINRHKKHYNLIRSRANEFLHRNIRN